ncbi:exonuclease RecJ [Anaerovirgula multivorans]|uniref:Single-stranded-DNA-specific exonuclease RecJ n=1 Tax=Anaerovirgula multivorans TaxID=312168 RepID=A0A239DQF0_9FIRM|nr:single-stranded-DNA-specific exonuclease RecJ [Anaerovirgula multivorans]SNS33824.1 exonuclease RecJ [Anaerovirgula multivorans]
MGVQKKKWIYRDHQNSEIEKLADDLNITKTTAKILLNRGINELEKAKTFLTPKLEDLYDPFLLKDMDKAVRRIKQALENKESIWIYGDYDVDGVTSVSLLVRYFNSIDCPVNYYIPDRMEEGYGINKGALRKIAEKGGNLIITVDCGITSVEEVDYATLLGVDMIITDHHHCHTTLPEAYAVVNPKQENCQYPFDKLCGCGVAFKLIQALTSSAEFNTKVKGYLDIVAIATVADIVSLVEENRIFVKNGLKCIEKTQNVGIEALLEVCGLKGKQLNSGNIGFMIAPRINAAGRISSAEIGVKLLTTNNDEEAKHLAQILDEENRNRQQLEAKIVEEALKIIESQPKYQQERVLVLYNQNWHHGVIGIVASRILEKYYKPTIILSIEDGIAKGSARSISSFDIFEALSQCKELFIKFGGHEQAAGLSLDVDNIEAFREKINNIADEMLHEEDLIPQIFCDDKLTLNDIDDKLIGELEVLEPFGLGNASPRFLNLNLKPKELKRVGTEGKHLKMQVAESNRVFDTIGFNLGEYKEYISLQDKVALVFSPEFNVFNGNKKIQLNVKDIKIMKTNEAYKIKEAKEYYKRLQFTQYDYNFSDYSLDSIPIITDSNKDDMLLKAVQQQNKLLILVNTIYQAYSLIKLSEIREKSTDININIFYHETPCYCGDKEVHIVINPNIDKIQFKLYNSIIVYDMFFSQVEYDCLANKNNNQNIMVFYSQGDEKYNLEILKSIIPTREDLVILYKFLKKYDGKKSIKLENLLYEIQNSTKIHINEKHLQNALTIFQEGQLVQYHVDDDKYSFNILKVTKKVNIEELDTFKQCRNLLNNFIDFINQWSDGIKGGSYHGFIKKN